MSKNEDLAELLMSLSKPRDHTGSTKITITTSTTTPKPTSTTPIVATPDKLQDNCGFVFGLPVITQAGLYSDCEFCNLPTVITRRQYATMDNLMSFGYCTAEQCGKVGCMYSNNAYVFEICGTLSYTIVRMDILKGGDRSKFYFVPCTCDNCNDAMRIKPFELERCQLKVVNMPKNIRGTKHIKLAGTQWLSRYIPDGDAKDKFNNPELWNSCMYAASVRSVFISNLNTTYASLRDSVPKPVQNVLPVVQPVVQPVVKPVVQPTVQPTVQQTVKPTIQPTEQQKYKINQTTQQLVELVTPTVLVDQVKPKLYFKDEEELKTALSTHNITLGKRLYSKFQKLVGEPVLEPLPTVPEDTTSVTTITKKTVTTTTTSDDTNETKVEVIDLTIDTISSKDGETMDILPGDNILFTPVKRQRIEMTNVPGFDLYNGPLQKTPPPQKTTTTVDYTYIPDVNIPISPSMFDDYHTQDKKDFGSYLTNDIHGTVREIVSGWLPEFALGLPAKFEEFTMEIEPLTTSGYLRDDQLLTMPNLHHAYIQTTAVLNGLRTGFKFDVAMKDFYKLNPKSQSYKYDLNNFRNNIKGFVNMYAEMLTFRLRLQVLLGKVKYPKHGVYFEKDGMEFTRSYEFIAATGYLRMDSKYINPVVASSSSTEPFIGYREFEKPITFWGLCKQYDQAMSLSYYQLYADNRQYQGCFTKYKL